MWGQSCAQCGLVLAQMWASPGADVGQSWRRCGPVLAQMWVNPGADVGCKRSVVNCTTRRASGHRVLQGVLHGTTGTGHSAMRGDHSGEATRSCARACHADGVAAQQAYSNSKQTNQPTAPSGGFLGAPQGGTQRVLNGYSTGYSRGCSAGAPLRWYSVPRGLCAALLGR